jgi:hypothetical protein
MGEEHEEVAAVDPMRFRLDLDAPLREHICDEAA